MSRALLLEPFDLAGLELRNRIISTSHASAYAEDGLPGERYQRYHEVKAEGGVALTMFGGSSIITPETSPIYRQIDVSTDAVIPHLAAFASRIHRHGTALMCQISHMGRRTTWDDGDWIVPIAPSSVRDPAHHAVPRAMTVADIDRVVEAYGAAARRCADAGIDGVEVMVSSHLPGQFLSPEANHRDDEYGGPLAHRARFLERVLAEIRTRTPTGFVVSLRMSVDESGEGGADRADLHSVATRLREHGLYDLLNLNGIGAITTRGLAELIGGMATPLAPHVRDVASFREGIDAPVAHASRIADVDTAAHAVASGAVDLVGMTRALFADPYLVAKLASGRAERIRPCVGAAMCIDRVYMGREAYCAHNPATGRETWLPQVIAPCGGPRRRVVVVGGGPAGLEAARVAASRGHDVVLFEAAPVLGGQVRVAARASSRRDLAGIVDWLEAEVRLLGVDVRVGEVATPDGVLREQPDVIVVATGGSPRAPDVPGGELAVAVADVLAGRVVPGHRVLIFDEDGRHAAVSVAWHLAERGHEVVVATPDRMLGRELGGASYPVYLARLADHGVRTVTDHHLVAIERTTAGLVARLRHAYADADLDVDCDTLVTELGTAPHDELFDALAPLSRNRGETDVAALRDGAAQPWFLDPTLGGDGPVVVRFGDAVASRDIHAALLDAVRVMKDC